MSYPDCKTHAGRSAELVCLSNECSKRLTLQCTVCVNSTCKKHNWKLMQQAIEEIFELCQNQFAKDDKRKKQQADSSRQQLQVKDEVEKLLSEFTKKIKIREQQIMASVNLRAEGLLSKNNKSQQLYVVVRNKINDFRKSNDRSFNNLNNILGSIKTSIEDDDGMLLFTSEPSSIGGILAPQVKDFQNYLNSFLQGNKLVRRDSQKSQQSPIKQREGNQKEIDQLKNHYESQINNLIQQVKSIPILKSRIESINLKLQAKDQKLKRYEEGAPKTNLLQSPLSTNPLKNSQIINEKVKQSQGRAKRIQKLLEKREKIKGFMYNYTIKNRNQQVQLHKVLKNQDPHEIDIKNCYDEHAHYLNMVMVVLTDELSYLQYCDKEDKDSYLQMQIISKKNTDYRSHNSRIRESQDLKSGYGGYDRPYGTTRSYYPSYY